MSDTCVESGRSEVHKKEKKNNETICWIGENYVDFADVDDSTDANNG